MKRDLPSIHISISDAAQTKVASSVVSDIVNASSDGAISYSEDDFESVVSVISEFEELLHPTNAFPPKSDDNMIKSMDRFISNVSFAYISHIKSKDRLSENIILDLKSKIMEEVLRNELDCLRQDMAQCDTDKPKERAAFQRAKAKVF
jgi:hypothetical protein